MHPIARLRFVKAFLPLLLILALVLSTTLAVFAVTLVQISSDPFTNRTSQHKTQVEPDTFSFGNTIVSTFQSGRFFDGGSSDIGWATSTDGGTTWTHGFLPGITKYFGNGRFDRVSDPAVAYDAKHNVWLISSLALLNVPSGVLGAAVLTSRSTDGGLTWSQPFPVTVARDGQDLDKNWIVCDNSPLSPFYGNCYTTFDDFGHRNLALNSTSTDGGMTWSTPITTADSFSVIGGQPLVQPNGNVVVPIDDAFELEVRSYMSTDGGASWSKTVRVAFIQSHTEGGGLRSGPLPSAEIDSAGKVYVVWADCRFRAGCSANDIVMSTTLDGTNWSPVTRVPIDSLTSGADHFIPGLAVDRTTALSSAHLGLAFYEYPKSSCTLLTCRLIAGFISSTDGGATWASRTQLTTPVQLPWLANTTQGRMVGDYISTSFVGGMAFSVFADARPPASGICDVGHLDCQEAMFTVQGGLMQAAGEATMSAANDRPVAVAPSPAVKVRQTHR